LGLNFSGAIIFQHSVNAPRLYRREVDIGSKLVFAEKIPLFEFGSSVEDRFFRFTFLIFEFRLHIYRSDFIMKKILSFLPLFILFALLLSRIYMSFAFPVFYDYDEMVISAISKEPYAELMDTVRAEPHPPGLYLLLKYVPKLDEDYIARIFMAFTGFVLFFVALTIAWKKDLINHFSLGFGLSIFFSSDTIIEIFSRVKQDLISFPLLLIVFFLSLWIFQKRRFDKKIIIFLHFLCALLLVFGYIAYFQAIFLVFVVTLLFREEVLSRTLMALQILWLVFYLAFYGIEQLKIMLMYNRISWLSEYSNSFVNGLMKYLVGQGAVSIFSDVILVAFLGILFFGFGYLKNMKGKEVRLSLYIYAFLLLIAGYFTHGFARERYTLFLFFLLSVFAGWGMELLARKYRRLGNILIYCVIFYFIYNLSSQLFFEVVHNEKVSEFNQKIEDLSDSNPTGLMFESATYGFLNVVEFGLSENLVPYDVYHPDITTRDVMSRKFLMTEYYSPKLLESEIRLNFKEKNLDSYFYLLGIKNDKSKYDPEKLAFLVLSSSCAQKVLNHPDPSMLLFHFENCKF
jgi:hypothetical protein